MARVADDLAQRLAQARDRAGFSQDEVAVLVGQPRPVVSAWETGARRPSLRELEKLAMIYRTEVAELLGQEEEIHPQLEQLLFRDAGGRLDAGGKFQLQRFLAFLDEYGDLLHLLDEPPGLTRSPFRIVDGFLTKEDVRRRADEARSFLGIGDGAVVDLVGAADAAGITVYFAPLGADLMETVSGAFVPHREVGFAVVVNALTTPGHRQFTLAHELAHALFHGDHPYVGYYGRREAAERFANMLAAEFLVPVSALRARTEALGIARVTDPETAVYLQRYFLVSYRMLLVRLRAAGLASDAEIQKLKDVRPVHLAESLGFVISPDEWSQDPDTSTLARFHSRFLRLLRRALRDEVMSVSRAAAVTGLAQDAIEEFMAEPEPSGAEDDEYRFLAASG